MRVDEASKDLGISPPPADWSVAPLKAFATRKSERGYSDAELLSVYRDYGVIPKAQRNDNFNKPSDDLSSYLYVRDGDLVVNKMKAWQGSLAVSRFSGIVSPAYFTYRVDGSVDGRYLHYLLRSAPYAIWYRRMSKGIRPNQWDLEPDAFSRTPILLPPMHLQRGIANYLDEQTAAIDALIEKKRKLLELLAEERAALINQAVTKGLDPNVPMKDAGIPWIGEVPVHWGVTRLKHSVIAMVDCHHSTPVYEEDGQYSALRTADISPGVLDVGSARRVNEYEFRRRIARLKPRRGDIVYSREGERYGMAAPIPPGVDVCLAQRVMLFRPNREADAAFLMWTLNSRCIYRQMEQYVVGATSPHVNIGDIREAWIPLPPKSEQELIGAAINRSVSRNHSFEGLAERQINRLQEYRQALITAAVTGQLDIEAAA